MKLSIIIPVYNEISFIKELYKSIVSVFNKENVEYIFVNDGSVDGSKEFLESKINKNNKNLKFINLISNCGKGFAVRKGIEKAEGDYILFLDSDLEYDPKDAYDMFELVKKNNKIEVLFGSRFLSGKIKSRKYIINEIIAKFNSFIFNILFNQSVSDIHCGTKIISKKVMKQLNLKLNDFGFEIDLSTQIAKNNFKIYEYGISYFARTYKEGKKITWKDGALSYLYFIKTRFFENDISVILSIIYSCTLMTYVGSYFGMGIGNILSIFIFFIFGSFLGLSYKMFSSSIIFIFIYFGSLFSQGNGKILTCLLFLLLGLFLSKKISKLIFQFTNNKLIKFFV